MQDNLRLAEIRTLREHTAAMRSLTFMLDLQTPEVFTMTHMRKMFPGVPDEWIRKTAARTGHVRRQGSRLRLSRDQVWEMKEIYRKEGARLR